VCDWSPTSPCGVRASTAAIWNKYHDTKAPEPGVNLARHRKIQIRYCSLLHITATIATHYCSHYFALILITAVITSHCFSLLQSLLRITSHYCSHYFALLRITATITTHYCIITSCITHYFGSNGCITAHYFGSNGFITSYYFSSNGFITSYYCWSVMGSNGFITSYYSPGQLADDSWAPAKTRAVALSSDRVHGQTDQRWARADGSTIGSKP
jgi:hypothetical protein